MGFVHVNVALSNPADPATSEDIPVLVDTGATLSVLPAALLHRLGIQPEGRSHFRGFGGVVNRETGGVRIRYGDAVATVTVVFGGETDPAVLGVTALESLGYEVDPTRGELHRVDMLI